MGTYKRQNIDFRKLNLNEMKKILIILSLFGSLLLVRGVLALDILTGNTNSTALDGINQSWEIADNQSVSLGASSTIAMWVNADTPGSTVFDFVAKYAAAGDQRAFRFTYQDEAGFRGFIWGTSSDGVGGASVKTGVWNYTLATTTWTHIAVTNSTAGACVMYVNGSAITISQDQCNTTIFNNTPAFTIGKSISAGPYDGRIDDLRIWKRTLTATEISDLYTTPCNFTNGDNFSGQWLFDDNGNDDSGQGNTLTNNNSSTFVTSVGYSCGGAGGAPPTIGDIIWWE